MMKHMRKRLSLALVLIAVFSMTTIVCASSIDDANEGQITVANPLEGQTYTAYKIFDVSYNDDAYAYTIASTSEWLTTVQRYTGITLTGPVTDINGNTFYTAAPNANFSAAGFAAALKNAVSGKTGTALTASGTTATATDLPLGYYFVSSTSGALCNLTTTNPDATIRDKNDVPFDKVASDTSVELGQTVTFTITGKVPDTTGFTTYTYQISDTMSDGLTFQKNVAVTIGGNTVALTPTYTNTGFTLDIPVMDYNAGDEIVLTYTAVVNENAISQVEVNSAALRYSNDPTDSTSTTTLTDEEKVYTAKIVIDKIDGADSTKLKDAKFVLLNGDGEFYYWNATSNKVEWVTAQNQATVVNTDANGAGVFIGLEDGVYSLKEVEAPLGYNLLKDPVSVTVNGSDADVTTLTVTAQVTNNTGSTLPETGGPGTTTIYIVGGILVAVTAILLITKKRMAS